MMNKEKKYTKYTAFTDDCRAYTKYDLDEFDAMIDDLEEHGIKIIKKQKSSVTEVIEEEVIING